MTNDKLDELERAGSQLQMDRAGNLYVALGPNVEPRIITTLPELVARVRELETALQAVG